MVSKTTAPFIVLVSSFFTIPAPTTSTTTTPYGTVLLHTIGDMVVAAPAPPRARVYALKAMGYERCIEIFPVWATNRLLAIGDILLPHDVVDCTRATDSTFFVGKGYGFVHHAPPYCPALRDALHEAATQVCNRVPLPSRPRVFQRGTYVAVDTIADASTARPTIAAQWGVDAVGAGGAPTSFLSRELELCYAPFGVVVGDSAWGMDGEPVGGDVWEYGDDSLLAQIVARAGALVPPVRTCACPTTMQTARERGLIGKDWHTWIE